MARARSFNIQSCFLLFLALTYLSSASLFRRHGVGGDDDDEEMPMTPTAAMPALPRPSAVISGAVVSGMACNNMAGMRKRHGAEGDDDDKEMPMTPTAAIPTMASKPSAGASGMVDCGPQVPQAPNPVLHPPTGMHGDKKLRRDAHIAHGVVMCLAICLFFPMGAILLRTIESGNAVRIHYLWQTFGLFVMIVGFALGVWMSWLHNEIFTEAHETFGIALVFLFLIQPVIGIMHHMYFKKHGHATWMSPMHVWLGRILIVMGVINGGIGLMQSGNVDLGGYITYIVEIILIAIAYIGVVGTYYWRKHKRAQQTSHVAAPQPMRFPADSSQSSHGGFNKEFGVHENRV